MKDKVLIANGQGFWGDSILGPIRLLREGPLDYLTLDYLAEVTMSIMQKLKSRDPSKGYATDFVRLIERVLPDLVKTGTRVVANAGGVNPHACKDAILEVCRRQGISGIKIAVVEGDDMLEDLDGLMAKGEPFNNMDTGAPLSTVRDRVTSANAYLGAFPIAEALAQGAQIVITGRGTDPGLVIGPMIHEFDWGLEDWDRLAAGTVAGHIVECGAQCTGGNHTDWRTIPDLDRIGYPIIEMTPSGEFTITKHEGTGGRVDRDSVVHQLAYEMGDPRAYLTPDVVADFTSFSIEETGPERVTIRGVKGAPATETYKVSMSYRDGWKSTGQLTVSGPEALAKARLCAEIVWKRLASDGFEYSAEERMVEFVGANVCHAGIEVDGGAEPCEVVLRMGVKGPDRDKVNRFGSELVPLVTSGPPGVTGFAGGRPKATEIIGYWPALVSKSHLQTRVTVHES
jgi:Acyclic terpene utilisation family protein AtuA